MANGKLMVRLRQSANAQSLLSIWDPVANSVMNLTAAAPQLFLNGLGTMAHTGDRTKILVAANDSSGPLTVFDANGNVLASPIALGTGTISVLAANADGSRFAAELVSGGSAQLFLLNSTLGQATAPIPFQHSA